MGLTDDLTVLRDGLGAVTVPRDVVRATGPDAVTFLQGQLSQDVSALAPGESAFSLLLQPEGKVSTFLRVTRLGEEELVLDTDAGYGDAMVARLERFKLRVRCDLEVAAWSCVAVRGAGAAEVEAPPEGTWQVVPETPGLPGVDLLGPDPTPPAGAVVVDPAAYEVLRIEAGVPRMGAELDGATIPAAAGVVERSVSFTKGCYTGQELVARIDSRGGNTPTRLCGVRVLSGDVPPHGAALVIGDADVGAITSVAPSADGGAVALAYVRRAVDPPADAVVRWERGEAAGRIESLPLR
jgi:tRNA-modifying protein YgfZ